MIKMWMGSNKNIMPHNCLYFLTSKFSFQHGHGYESYGLAWSILKGVLRIYVPELHCQNSMIINAQISHEYSVSVN